MAPRKRISAKKRLAADKSLLKKIKKKKIVKKPRRLQKFRYVMDFIVNGVCKAPKKKVKKKKAHKKKSNKKKAPKKKAVKKKVEKRKIPETDAEWKAEAARVEAKIAKKKAAAPSAFDAWAKKVTGGQYNPNEKVNVLIPRRKKKK